jgi:molybdopterin-guanine dinucleotide biosynthesis protein A
MRAAEVTGLILAGGQGRRMGGIDKGLQPFRGRALVEWVVERLEPQVDELLINCNQNLDSYARLGHSLVRDRIGGFAGPLAGLHAGLSEARSPLVVTAPCDSPYLPLDLVARLRRALEARQAQLAVARTGTQSHPVFSLCRRDLLDHLAQYLAGGGRKIDAWYASLGVAEVSFDDEAEAFANINTLEELESLAREDRSR